MGPNCLTEDITGSGTWIQESFWTFVVGEMAYPKPNWNPSSCPRKAAPLLSLPYVLTPQGPFPAAC